MRRPRTVFDLLVVFFGILSLLAEWTVAIPPARMPETFGYQQPACWVVCIGLAAAVILDASRAILALVFTEGVLAAWFVWAAWTVTMPRFTKLPFPFVPMDVMGSGFYTAGAALLVAAAAVVYELRRRHEPPRTDVWLLAALPGFGLMRLGSWLRGLMWCALACGAFYLAAADSPDSTQFQEYGRFGTVPPPYPRGAAWVLLAMAGVVFAVSVALTVARRREESAAGR